MAAAQQAAAAAVAEATTAPTGALQQGGQWEKETTA